MKLVTVGEMRSLEQAADASGHSYRAMMERAGEAVARAIQQRMEIKDKRVLLLVGPGNNGGDGLVAARYLSKAGAQIVCYLWKPRSDDDATLQGVKEEGIHCIDPAKDGSSRMLRQALRNVDVIVDALLGTGITRPIEGQLEELLRSVREAVDNRRGHSEPDQISLVPQLTPDPAPVPAPLVVAVDVPSGLDCDTGQVDPATLPADLTVTFAAPKRGQFRFPGAGAVGQLVVADIGIDPDLGPGIQTRVATVDTARSLLPARPPNAHKGTFGKAMVVAGSVNYTGAPYLAAAAAARVGTGLVTLAPPQPLYPVLAAKLTEATFVLLPHNLGVLVPQAVKVLLSELEGYSALLLGPGLGHESETVEFVHQLLGIAEAGQRRRIGFQRNDDLSSEHVSLPALVIDADGLNALASANDWWKHIPENSVLTPHPGEMCRLADLDSGTVNDDRIAVAREKAQEWNQVVVLKGAYTVVAAPDGRVTLLPFANPALATAGTGDVLAGAIVGLLAQGLAPFDAAVCGAYLHGLAGEIVAEQVGTAGMLASDLLPALPQSIALLSRAV